MNVYDSLYDWQRKIVDEFQHRQSFGLFLKMGLGKTPISLAFAEQNGCTKILVITINPKAIEDEFVNGSFLWWAKQSDMNYTLSCKLYGPSSTTTPHIYVVNYESLFSRSKQRTSKHQLKQNIVDFINSCKHKNVALIIDESHKCKNLQAQQTAAILQIRRDLLCRAKDVCTYLLTGTPFTTGYIDVYAQLKLLGYPETKGQFIDEFCIRGQIPGLLGWQQPIVGYKNVPALFRLIHNYAITMESTQVANLPEQIFIDHQLSMSKDFLMFIREKVKGIDLLETFARHQLHIDSSSIDVTKTINNPFYRDIDYEPMKSSKWLAETSGTFWLRARQLSIGFQGNAEASKWFDKRRFEQLELFLANNEDNYVVFYNYVPELLELYDICDRLGYNIDVYCGEIKSLRFYEQYSNMNDSDKLVNKKNVILANFASGSTGKNWQEYSSCIITSVPLYKDYEQGIARIHRLGQKMTTTYHLFYQKNWLDEGMLKALKQQQDYSLQMFESDLIRLQSILE